MDMNLIQQAVERAEREPKWVASPLPHLPGLGHVHSRSFRPTPMNKSRAPLAAAALALLALLGGAGLYAALAHTQGERSAPVATKPIELPVIVKAVPPPLPVAPAVARAAEPVVAAVMPAPALAPAPDPIDEAKTTVEAWARAWSERDVATYLGYYGDGFAPTDSASRAAWEKSRRQMIERRRNIAVTVRNLRVEQVSDQRVVARYTQDYVADAYRESGTPKRLVLAREGQVWRIVAEGTDKADTGTL
jgi:hypothetical protein